MSRARRVKVDDAPAPSGTRLYARLALDITPAALAAIAATLKEYPLRNFAGLKPEVQKRVRMEVDNFINECHARVDRMARGE